MCGIAGIIGEQARREVLEKMTVSQHHRGPDHTGYWFGDNASLGHNRLSIIDLSEQANQPFSDDDNRYQLVFNGEIYNYLELKEVLDYEFKTASDTEVLLAAYLKWGKDCLHKLNGMFAFAIWDTKDQTLFAARDRFGVKPFYYQHDANSFYFSSEIKALHEAGINKEPNQKTWANYLVYGSYGMPDETFWKSIHQLPGGHYLELHTSSLKISKWYHFEKEIIKQRKEYSYEEAKKKYISLLEDSIRLRFRSDVSVGFTISGGVDSSALLAFVNKNQTKDKIKAFTFYTGDDRYDELPWVEELIKLTKNPLYKVKLKANEVDGMSKKICFHQDEPFGGIPTLAYAKLFEKARNENILVILDGQGMDEQWAGYDYYMKSTDENIIQGLQKSPFKKEVLSKELLVLAKKPIYPTPFKDTLLDKQYRDLFYTKIPRALRFNDRISMAYSTELREPFLDYRLVEFAFSQPKDYKINNGVQKFMLREIVADYLSDSITYAPKRPLQTPQREWLGNELKEFVTCELQNLEKSKIADWFNFDLLKQEYKKYLDGDNNSSFHIWQWVNLSLCLNYNNEINS
ncbi:asparagine synthase (glutamine-hydrolyzing) [Winogradskyella sp.]|uniref:asparagine synthase (glutamine-hydrolyzing) n=1 Tax=Winogradskyella sp. TaxID=1883156 RepID=UPI003AB87103